MNERSHGESEGMLSGVSSSFSGVRIIRSSDDLSRPEPSLNSLQSDQFVRDVVTHMIQEGRSSQIVSRFGASALEDQPFWLKSLSKSNHQVSS